MRQNDRSDGSDMSMFSGESPVATMVATSTTDIEMLVKHDIGSENRAVAPTIAEQQKTAVVSVLLVDDHALMREGLRQLLELEEDIHVVGEAVDGFDALQKIRRLGPLRPDV